MIALAFRLPVFFAVALVASQGPVSADPAPKDPAALAAACDAAAGMPATAAMASPDMSLFTQGEGNGDTAHLEAVVSACAAAAQANPKEGRFEHRIGIAEERLKHPDKAAAALTRSMDLGFPGGFDDLAGVRFSGALAPALPKDPAKAIEIAEKGIATTGNPEIKRDLAGFLLKQPPSLAGEAGARQRTETIGRARKLLEEAAAAGHGPAMADLAGHLAVGNDGFPQDPARARTLLDTAIAAGSRSATYELALLIDNCSGFPNDPKQARALYLKSAEAGDAEAMTSISDMMAKGDGGPRDMQGARHWMAREAALGNLDARRGLANLYLHEDPKNTAVGLQLMTEAADAGLTQAKYALADDYKDGIDVAQDPRLALEWYRKAAEAGEPRAFERIGSMYDYGEGVPVDHAEARRWYDKALAADVPAAYTAIGMQYDHGRGVPENVVEALDWYRKGAAKGAGASVNNVGFAYENGRGVKRDLAEAVKWYTKAVELDDPSAENTLGNMYLDGNGVKKDRLTGLALLRKAADHKLAQALNDLALLEMKEPRPDGPGAVRLLRQAAAQHLAVSYLNLAQALTQGWDDGRLDFQEANYWYKEAIDNPSDIQPIVKSESLFHLGENMVLGRGIARNVAQGNAMIQAAARAGNPTALAYLAHRGSRGTAHVRHRRG